MSVSCLLTTLIVTASTILGCAATAPSRVTSSASVVPPDFTPKAQQVTPQVYSIVGPLGQRSKANSGLNANYGFIVTPAGVILIDSGASAHSAALLEGAVKAVTSTPIRWLINTGSQDHRWLGNRYFATKGVEIHALAATAATQTANAAAQLDNMTRFVGEQMKGTVAEFAAVQHEGNSTDLNLGGQTLRLIRTDAHLPGDSMVHLPVQSVNFTGDLVFVDRLVGILPMSSVRKAQPAFMHLKSLNPQHVVPGHGRVTDMAQAQAYR